MKHIYRFGVSTTHSQVQTFNKLQTHKIDYYKSLRIYKHHKYMDLLNSLVVNQALRYDLVVDNAMVFYQTLHKVFGKNLANKIIDKTISRVFTAGANLSDVERFTQERQNGVSIILDYCSEALEGLEDQESFFEMNSQTFRNTVLVSAKNNGMVAVKISGLAPSEFLRKYSQAQQRVVNFVKQDESVFHVQMRIIQKLQQRLQKELGVSEEEAITFVQEFLDSNSTITPTIWRYHVHSCYLHDFYKNENPIIRKFNEFSVEDLTNLKSLQKRVTYFMEPASQLNVGVLIDAEQTYFQPAIDSICEQLEKRYNTNYNVCVFNTFQNYLKSAPARVEYEISKAKTFSRPIAIKMVRGAYMVEENKISLEQGLESPICDSYQHTSNNYHENLKKLLNFRVDLYTKVIIASHNEETVEIVKEHMKQQNMANDSNEIMFAQLHGLSDHLTYSLKAMNYKVYKYMPFGQTDIMIPYLIRRAQETRKMLAANRIQTTLLRNELLKRII